MPGINDIVVVHGAYDKMIRPLAPGAGVAGGQGGIRTRGGCYTTHAFQACALNHSATCPESGPPATKL